MNQIIPKIQEFIHNLCGKMPSETDSRNLIGIVLNGKKEQLTVIEQGYCAQQKQACVDAITDALDKYYHPAMSLVELKKIVTNVTENRAESPEITETVRLLLV